MQRWRVASVDEYDARIYDHQLPGGMTGTFRAQLAAHGMEDRFDAVLDEIPRVRQELGYPVSATPFSRFIGTQALMNIVTGERYPIRRPIDELVALALDRQHVRRLTIRSGDITVDLRR